MRLVKASHSLLLTDNINRQFIRLNTDAVSSDYREIETMKYASSNRPDLQLLLLCIYIQFVDSFAGVCGELFTDNVVLQNHLRSHQETTTRLFSCSLCGVVYANRQQLETHMQTHMSQQAGGPTTAVTLQTGAQQSGNVVASNQAGQTVAGGGQVAQSGGQATALNGETRVSFHTCWTRSIQTDGEGLRFRG